MNFESDVIIAHAIHKFTLNKSQCNMQLVHINYWYSYLQTSWNMLWTYHNVQNKTNVHELTAAHIAKHLSLFVCSNYRIVGNFCWCKFLRKSVQTLQKKFSRFLFSRMWDSLSDDGHVPYANRHWTTKRRSKPVQQWPDLPFVWRLSKLRRYQDCRRG